MLLALACSGQKIASETPRDELPKLILPRSLAAESHTTSGGVRGETQTDSFAIVTNDDDDPREADAHGAFVTASPQPTAYAFIVGIEDYRDVTDATGARHDAERFAELVRVTFGVPEGNIRVLLDERASRTDVTKQLRWLRDNVPAGARVYFYYSGHGAPEPTTGTTYLVPFDGDPQYLEDTAIPMNQILAELEQTKAKEVLAFADSCFSGAGGRSVLAPGTRPLVRVQAPTPKARVAYLSASSGSEISGATADGSSGLFSRYVIEGLGSGQADLDGDGQISLEELTAWVRPRVEREARRANREQTPHLMLGRRIGSAKEFIVGWGYAR